MRATSNQVPGLNMTAPCWPDSGSTFTAFGDSILQMAPGARRVLATTGPAMANGWPRPTRLWGSRPGNDSA